jgi:hypothetical protein
LNWQQPYEEAFTHANVFLILPQEIILKIKYNTNDVSQFLKLFEKGGRVLDDWPGS